MEAFSDAVIAIAITLLVLEIHVPSVGKGDLFDALVDQWPSFAGFIISFVVIGTIWASHHSMFERIKTVDRPFMFLNLLLLMGIGFLPYPTSVLATYLAKSGANEHVAAALYSITMVAIGLVFLAMWAWLYMRPELLVDGIPPERVRMAMIRSMVGPIVYAFTIGLAFISAEACLLVYGAISIYFMLGRSAKAATPDDAAPVPEAEPV
jgi:uncharacterized membrane protein